MNNSENPRVRHQITFDVEENFKARIRLLAAKWHVKSNVAMQRAVDQALAGKWSEDEKTLLKLLAVRSEEILRLLIPQ